MDRVDGTREPGSHHSPCPGSWVLEGHSAKLRTQQIAPFNGLSVSSQPGVGLGSIKKGLGSWGSREGLSKAPFLEAHGVLET